MRYKRALRYLIWIALPCLVIAFLWLILYTLRLGFTDGLESKRGTFSYYVTITSATIRHVPIIKPVGEAIYSSGPGGVEPPWQDVEYASYEKKDVLISLISNYVKNAGYTEAEPEGPYGGIVFRKKQTEIEVGITDTTQNMTQIHVIVSFR